MPAYKVVIGVHTAAYLFKGIEIMVQTKPWFVFPPFGTMGCLPEVQKEESRRESREIQRRD